MISVKPLAIAPFTYAFTCLQSIARQRTHEAVARTDRYNYIFYVTEFRNLCVSLLLIANVCNNIDMAVLLR